MIIQTAGSKNIIINMVGGHGVPGPFGYAIPLVSPMMNKQTQLSQMIIQTNNP